MGDPPILFEEWRFAELGFEEPGTIGGEGSYVYRLTVTLHSGQMLGCDLKSPAPLLAEEYRAQLISLMLPRVVMAEAAK